MVVRPFFGIAFLWDWNEKLIFSSPMATGEFSRFATYCVQLMLKLKLQYFGHLMRTDLLEKTLMLRKIEGRRRG